MYRAGLDDSSCMVNLPSQDFCPITEGKTREERGAEGEGSERMTMSWGLTAYIVDMVWMVLAGWVSTCLVIAGEIARGMRNGEISPFFWTGRFSI
uniref:Uncharacterized protein n=1 Tax=Oryza punctata TaxID=4537 RepID=A0A0E0LII1_ORYPU